jgi:hypothetical protein
VEEERKRSLTSTSSDFADMEELQKKLRFYGKSHEMDLAFDDVWLGLGLNRGTRVVLEFFGGSSDLCVIELTPFLPVNAHTHWLIMVSGGAIQ